MDEIVPGVFHWTTRHPRIGQEVSSYWLDGPAVAIDPFVPRDEGLEAFGGRQTAVVLSCRHHLRDAPELGVPIHCNAHGLHEFPSELGVVGFEPGDELPGGIQALEVNSLSPDETALLLPDARALVIADGVVRGPHGIGFVPDQLMDDPEETKRGLLAAYRRILHGHEFDHVLLAHGGPIVGDGRAQLSELVESGGRTAFEL